MRLVRLLKFPSLRPSELWAALPAVALLLPVLLSAGFPETLERAFTVGVGPFGLFIPFGVGYLALPMVFFRAGCFDRRLFVFAVFFLLAGIASAGYGSLPSAGLFYGFCLFGTFALASKLSWTEREFRFLFWIPLMVVAGLGLQIVRFGTTSPLSGNSIVAYAGALVELSMSVKLMSSFLRSLELKCRVIDLDINQRD